MAYIYPCKSGGKCRQLLFEKWNLGWKDSYPKFGNRRVTVDNVKHNIPVVKGNYKCCTQCHLPLNQQEATKANKMYGNKLEEVVFDDEFMELLNGI